MKAIIGEVPLITPIGVHYVDFDAIPNGNKDDVLAIG